MAKKKSLRQRKTAIKAGSTSARTKSGTGSDNVREESIAKPKRETPPGELNVSSGEVKGIEQGAPIPRHEDLQLKYDDLLRINSQLAVKIEELEAKHANLKTFGSTADTATIWMDTELTVCGFTPSALQVIQQKPEPEAVARPIGDFAAVFPGSDLVQVAERVLKTLAPVEDEVTGRDGRMYFRRVSPYRSDGDRVGGVVVTFVEMTQRKSDEAEPLHGHELADEVIDTIHEGILVLDRELRVVAANTAVCRQFQFLLSEVRGRSIYDVANGQWDIPEVHQLLETVLPESGGFENMEIQHEFPSLGWRVVRLAAREITPREMIVLAIEDITAWRQADQQQQFLLDLSDAFYIADSVQDLLQEAATRLCRFLDCDRVAYLDVDLDREQVEVLIQHAEQLDEVESLLQLSDFGTGGLATLLRNEELVIDDIREDERFREPAHIAAFERHNSRSLACIPRQRQAGHLAVLVVARSEPHKWNAEELEIIREVANRTWSAMAAVRAEEALHDSRKQLATELSAMTRLHDLVARLLICPNLRTALEEVLVASIEITGADLGHVQLFDSQTRTLEIVAQRGFDRSYLDHFRTISNDHNSASGRALWEGERIAVEDVLSDPLYAPHRELATRAGYRGVQSTPLLSRDGKLLGILSTHYRTPFRPSDRDLRVLDLYAQQAADFIERIGIEVKLHELNQSLEKQVRQRTEMLMILQDITRAANEARTVEAAMYAALVRIEEYNGWQVGHVWRLADNGSGQFTTSGIWHVSEKARHILPKLGEFRILCQQIRYLPGEGLVGAVAQSGRPQWLDDIAESSDTRSESAKALGLHAVIAFPVTVNDDVIAVMEFFSDHPANRDERFMEIMPDVGIQLGHVIERKRLEKLIADATEQEQRRLGSDIHDGVGQELTGLRYMAGTHAEVLAEQSSPEAEIAQRIADGLGTVQKGLRAIISDLVPVELDEKGLVAALGSLAERIAYSQDIECEFECDPAVAIEDTSLATHMYRIGQEAANNAVKHARARHITITLLQENGDLTMRVIDDGVGMQSNVDHQCGVGLRSMAFRAGLIGARLDISPGEFGGTIVECRVRLSNEIPTNGKRQLHGRMNWE